MVRFSIPWVVLLLWGGVGCAHPDERPKRSEPWLKDEVALSRSEQTLLRYRAEPGQALQFSVHTKQVNLRGVVPLGAADLELDPRALDLARGELTFDLASLSLQRVGEGEEGAAEAGDLLLAEAARLWLNLGPEVPSGRRAEAERAHFSLEMGRGLSSHSVQGGTQIAAVGANGRRIGSVRRVTGTALGDLLLLGREVTHVVKVEVDFIFPPGQRDSGPPEHVVVRLSEAEGVPLAEHGIAPRDTRGAVVSEQWAAFGRSPGLRAVVTGSLRFERARE